MPSRVERVLWGPCPPGPLGHRSEDSSCPARGYGAGQLPLLRMVKGALSSVPERPPVLTPTGRGRERVWGQEGPQRSLRVGGRPAWVCTHLHVAPAASHKLWGPRVCVLGAGGPRVWAQSEPGPAAWARSPPFGVGVRWCQVASVDQSLQPNRGDLGGTGSTDRLP